MINITHKNFTLRKAVAEAFIKVGGPDTISAIRDRKVPKGDVIEASRVAGLFAAKKTHELIPDCHPLPVEYCHISHEIGELQVRIEVEVHTIYRTGVEVEAMHAASVVALTMYDMLKPIDKNIEISTIRLVAKKGGKSDFSDRFPSGLTAMVLVCSDTVSAGKKEDKAGKLIIEKLKGFGVLEPGYKIIPDDPAMIRSVAEEASAQNIDLLLITGGTGLSPRDLTPESIRPLFDREIPGIMESARSYGQQRTPYAMLSRGIAGMIRKTLVITLPGSTRGAGETMDALFPALFHIFSVREGARHDKKE